MLVQRGNNTNEGVSYILYNPLRYAFEGNMFIKNEWILALIVEISFTDVFDTLSLRRQVQFSKHGSLHDW